MTATKDFNDRLLSLGLARVSEAAAHASARLIGRGDEKAADQAAVNAMREQLNLLDIKGVVVIGEGERDEAPMLYIGEEVGSGEGPEVDIALDPLEGTTLTAKDMPNALTVIAMAPRGTLLHAPDVYMDKLAVGPGYDKDVVSLDMTPAERVHALAKAGGVKPEDITVCILERPRHEDMIAEVRATGAAIRLITDGVDGQLIVVMGVIAQRVLGEGPCRAVLEPLVHGQDDHLAGAGQLSGHQHPGQIAFHAGVLALIIGEDFLDGVGHLHRTAPGHGRMATP